MAVTRKKIRLQRPQIQRQLPNPMRAINETQNPKLATDLDDPLKRKPDTRHTNHRLKHRDPHIQPFRPRLTHYPHKPIDQLLHAQRKPKAHLPGLHGCVLNHRHEHAVNGPVHRIEVDDDIAALELQVVQHGVHGCGCVFDKHEVGHGDVEEGR